MVWMYCRRDKYFVPGGIRNLDCPAHGLVPMLTSLRNSAHMAFLVSTPDCKMAAGLVLWVIQSAWTACVKTYSVEWCSLAILLEKISLKKLCKNNIQSMRKFLNPRFGAEQKENMKMLRFKCRKMGYKPKKYLYRLSVLYEVLADQAHMATILLKGHPHKIRDCIAGGFDNQQPMDFLTQNSHSTQMWHILY